MEQGLPLWLPKGAALRGRLEDFLKKAQKKAGYEMVMITAYWTEGTVCNFGALRKVWSRQFSAYQSRRQRMEEEFLPETNELPAPL